MISASKDCDGVSLELEFDEMPARVTAIAIRPATLAPVVLHITKSTPLSCHLSWSALGLGVRDLECESILIRLRIDLSSGRAHHDYVLQWLEPLNRSGICLIERIAYP